jgi:FKBP-type peptidyl-prolyl cis-trans isomerase 2
MGSVVSIGDEVVTMDFNHPLAGEIMHFEGTVMGVREASSKNRGPLFRGCGCGSAVADRVKRRMRLRFFRRKYVGWLRLWFRRLW